MLRPSAVSDYAVLLSLVVLFVVLSFTATNFLTGENMLNILDQSTTLGIVAAAGTLVIIGGCFDLSVGAIFTMSGVIAAEVANHTDPTIGIVAGILSGAAFGLANGVAVSGVGINPFIATLASQIIIRGLALAITGGFLITVTAPSFTNLGANDFLGAKIGIWIFLAWTLLMGFLLAFTVFGRYVRACGGNEEAARLSGLRVGLIRTTTFVVSGVAASLAGVIAASRIATGEADVGVGLELTAVAAIVVGGTSIRGGQGAMWRTLVGVLLLSVISNGFDLLNINTVYEQVVYGGVILIAVGIDARARRSNRTH
jgi:ribose transport system permease protein